MLHEFTQYGVEIRFFIFIVPQFVTFILHAYILFHTVPPPAVSVTSPDNGLIYYAGSTLTLICTTNEVNELTGIAVTNTWTGPRGENILDSSQNERITVSDATKADNGTYTSMLVLTPLHMSDTGNYSCQAGVSHMSEFILSSDSSTSQVIISVQGNGS